MLPNSSEHFLTILPGAKKNKTFAWRPFLKTNLFTDASVGPIPQGLC